MWPARVSPPGSLWDPSGAWGWRWVDVHHRRLCRIRATAEKDETLFKVQFSEHKKVQCLWIWLKWSFFSGTNFFCHCKTDQKLFPKLATEDVSCLALASAPPGGPRGVGSRAALHVVPPRRRRLPGDAAGDAALRGDGAAAADGGAVPQLQLLSGTFSAGLGGRPKKNQLFGVNRVTSWIKTWT